MFGWTAAASRWRWRLGSRCFGRNYKTTADGFLCGTTASILIGGPISGLCNFPIQHKLFRRTPFKARSQISANHQPATPQPSFASGLLREQAKRLGRKPDEHAPVIILQAELICKRRVDNDLALYEQPPDLKTTLTFVINPPKMQAINHQFLRFIVSTSFLIPLHIVVRRPKPKPHYRV
jgi:hypothetical protein